MLMIYDIFAVSSRIRRVHSVFPIPLRFV